MIADITAPTTEPTLIHPRIATRSTTPLSLAPAPHDGLLLLAALTGNRRLLAAWETVERTREQSGGDPRAA